MNNYSEKAQRELDRYTRKLVRCQPPWLRKLFNEEKILFTLTDTGELEVRATNDVDKQTAEHAAVLLEKYIKRHPCNGLALLTVQ